MTSKEVAENLKEIVLSLKEENVSREETEKLMKLAISFGYGTDEEKAHTVRIEEKKKSLLEFCIGLKSMCLSYDSCDYCVMKNICDEAVYSPEELSDKDLDEIFA